MWLQEPHGAPPGGWATRPVGLQLWPFQVPGPWARLAWDCPFVQGCPWWQGRKWAHPQTTSAPIPGTILAVQGGRTLLGAAFLQYHPMPRPLLDLPSTQALLVHCSHPARHLCPLPAQGSSRAPIPPHQKFPSCPFPPSHLDRALSPDQVTAGPEGLPCSRAPPGSHEGSQEPW